MPAAGGMRFRWTRSRERWRETFLAVVIASVIVGVTSNTAIDPDLWGHLRFGLDILEQGDIHIDDPYSFTSDRTWINHEWLAEVALAFSYRVAGTAGLLILKLLLVIVAGHIYYKTLRIGSSPNQSRYLMLLPVIALMPQTQTVRPQLFSIVAFTVLLRLALRYRATRNPRYLLGLPVLFCIWANAHGGWVLGEATLLAVLAPLVVHASARERVVVAATVLAAAAAPLLNPYGIGLYRFLAETLIVPRPDITEWQRVPYAGFDSIALWLAIIAVAARAMWAGYWRRNRLYSVAILIFVVVAFEVVRVLGFAALVTVALLSVGGTRDVPPRQSRPLRLSAPELAVLAVTMGVSLAWAVSNLRCLRPTDNWAPASDDAAYIREALPSGHLLAWFNWGEYAIWHFGPAVKVSFDGRRETVYSQRFIEDHMNLYAAGPNWTLFLDRLAPDLVWLPPTLPLAKVLVAHGWQLVRRTPQSVIFSRSGLRHAPALSSARSALRCFPAP